MAIKHKIKEIAKSYTPTNPADITKKVAYSNRLLSKGILKNTNYGIPQVDTLGKQYCINSNLDNEIKQ